MEHTPRHHGSCDHSQVCMYLIDTTHSTEAFGPIYLQDCPVKIVTIVLTNRHKHDALVSGDHTRFLSGKCLSDNFFYAVDLLNCCHKTKSSTIVIKLDIQKVLT
jgi:hypothetical protein